MRVLIDKDQDKTEIDKIKLQKAYKELFSNDAGKAVLEDLASLSGMYRTNFVQDNSQHTSFLEGQRSVFLYICAQVESNNVNNIEGEI